MQDVKIANLKIQKKGPLTVILGPCVIESREHAFLCAEFLKNLTSSIEGLQFIFKASYDKANRSSIDTFRGVGVDQGLSILKEIKENLEVPVTSDVHTIDQIEKAEKVLDILQIPAFLCRQTDLVATAAKTQKPINVKKGQFLAPWDMKNVIDKITHFGNNQIILTDRGTSFGYNNLVSDFRAIPIMQSFGFPVCYDASHSIQLPGGLGTSSGGQREFIPNLSRAAIAAGADLIFLEAHPNPSKAKSDASSVFPFDQLEKLLRDLVKVYQAVNAL